ncbi:MAG: hydantoinase B/oxoprolinase family protein [Acidimicrobiia bacterium]|nr:hydantoinase B/oxoprolinase family protein [Acidimicrobiia bacterium]
MDKKKTGPALDGATVEVIRHHLNSTAEQMRRTLVRTAFNPVIYEVLDFGISMYDRRLRLISESSGILFFLGANDYAIHKGVEKVGVENLHPGDVVILNYPYWSGAHTADAMMFAPVFSEGSELPDAYLAVRAHWMDLGAKDPGYVLDSTSIHQEGLILPAVKLVRKSEMDSQMLNILRYNSRLPVNITGDFHAQIAALRVGERRLHQIWEKFGAATVDRAIDMIISHGAETAADAVREMPDGRWSAVDWLDDDGISHDLIRMAVTVTISEENFTVDFADSDAAVPGPVNMPFGCTQSLAKNIFKSLTTPDTPANHGHYQPLEVVCPPGNLFHAVYPSPTYTLWTGMAGFELINKALAQGLDGIHASSGSDLPGFMAVGNRPHTERMYLVSNNEGIGWGATPVHDGANALQHPSTSSVRNTSIEVLENEAPLFHERLELRQDSGGAGRWRGGLGVSRRVKFVAPGEVLSMKKKTKTRPWALRGGHEPETNAMVVWPDTDRAHRARMERFSMKADDSFHNLSAGGGGWGDPLDRPINLVLDDVVDGYVSAEQAEQVYGVRVAADGTPTPTRARIHRPAPRLS